jgi:hypothetical protein
LDIYLGAQALTLSIGATTPSTPSAATTFTFSTASFVAGGGKRYVLTLNIKQPMFASSNIYWDENLQQLSFAGYSDRPDTVLQNRYQGLYFKFGSLIGISPMNPWNAAATPLYLPKAGSGSSQTTADASHDDVSGWTGNDYTSIPYARANPAVTGNRNDRFVIDMPDSSAYMKGDICRYLQTLDHAPDPPGGKSWRLPTSIEFTSASTFSWNITSVVNGWKKVDGAWSPQLSTKEDGTFQMDTWGGKFGVTANFFPPAGNRNGSGELTNSGTSGTYWGGSVNSATAGFAFRYIPATVSLPSSNYHSGNAVRCVLD